MSLRIRKRAQTGPRDPEIQQDDQSVLASTQFPESRRRCVSRRTCSDSDSKVPVEICATASDCASTASYGPLSLGYRAATKHLEVSYDCNEPAPEINRVRPHRAQAVNVLIGNMNGIAFLQIEHDVD